jgi:NAD-dependent protein deacetylase/lipoamidase
MHGELLKARCTSCDSVHPWRINLADSHRCPGCAGENQLRPHFVWFGEMPLELDRIYDALAACVLFVAIGTSGQVYPAAGFVETVRAAGRAHTIELNLEPGATGSLFAEQRHGPATKLVPHLVTESLSGPAAKAVIVTYRARSGNLGLTTCVHSNEWDQGHGRVET